MQQLEQGSPAHVGIDHVRPRHIMEGKGFPRTRGDRPRRLSNG